MTETACPHEDRIREALAQGNLGPDLRDHAAACPVCRDVVTVSGWMGVLRNAMLKEFAAGAKIPAPSEILERARRICVPREADCGIILKPLRIYQRIALPFGIGAGIVVLILHASQIKELFLSLPGLRVLVSNLGSRPAGMSPSMLGLFLGLAGLGLLTIFVLAAATRFKGAER